MATPDRPSIPPQPNSVPAELAAYAGEFHWITPLSQPLVEDFRVRLLAEHLDLAGLRVLEPGCLEGLITMSLIGRGAQVTSFDIRPANLAKTWIRGQCHGVHRQMKLRLGDAMQMHEDYEIDEFDLIYHGGVLYHLLDPCTHLQNIAKLTKYLFLDTHIAVPDAKLLPIAFAGGEFYFHLYSEDGGWEDPAGGVKPLSMWFSQDSLLCLAHHVGLELVATIFDEPQFSMGPRGGWLFRRR